ncbi:MAG: hypothetical protein WC455_09000 [Dehalococcoidia bacterium]|jgi:hypothetical protein
MILHPPFKITPSLCAGLRIGDHSWISLLSAKAGENRGGEKCHIASQDWGFEIFTPDFVYINEDLNTAHGDIVHAFDDFLCFLTCEPDIMPGDEPLFPPHVLEWAKQNEDELSMLRSDITDDESGIARSELIEL